jgi:hypothetical protein
MSSPQDKTAGYETNPGPAGSAATTAAPGAHRAPGGYMEPDASSVSGYGSGTMNGGTALAATLMIL